MSTRRLMAAMVGVVSLAAMSMSGCASYDSGAKFQRMLTEEIYSLRYDAAEQVLTVVTRTGDVIEYGEIDPAVVHEWRQADDFDAFYRERIKGRQPFRTLDFSRPDPAAAPAPEPAAAPAPPAATAPSSLP